MRQRGRPRTERVLAEPYEIATGRTLAADLERWDAEQVPYTEMGRRVSEATGRRCGPTAVRGMLQRAADASEAIPEADAEPADTCVLDTVTGAYH